ncbi:MAG: peptidylprolyl isomerase, partial [Pirellulaceae bacterium]|nr:peptidylprolyl isomerase [Pirellulaceae bacterium]
VFGAVGTGISRILNRLSTSLDLTGKFPALQPTPPVTNITDPANLSKESSPAVQAAAKVKTEQDQAAQKVQALRYLATIGCGGCYPEVEEALLAALEDCTEKVRYEAVKALRGDSGKACEYCSSSACCGPKVKKKLNSMVYKFDKDGRRIEPSERIRRRAKMVLEICGPAAVDENPGIPLEGPTPEDPPQNTKVAISKDNPVSSGSLVDIQGSPTQTGLSRFQVGYVNSHPVFSDELDEIVKQRVLEQGKQTLADLDSGERALVMEASVGELVDRQLIRNEFIRSNDQFSKWKKGLEGELDLWLQEKFEDQSDIQPEETLTYYREHQAEYRQSATVSWEKASISFQDDAEMDQAVEVMNYLRLRAKGNSVVEPKVYSRSNIRIENFEVSRLDEISNEKLRKSLSVLPLGELSPLLREGNSVVLARVLARKPESLKRLETVTDAINKKILLQRRNLAKQRWLEIVRGRASVWTILDQSAGGQIANNQAASGLNGTADAAKIEPKGSRQVVAPKQLVPGLSGSRRVIKVGFETPWSRGLGGGDASGGSVSTNDVVGKGIPRRRSGITSREDALSASSDNGLFSKNSVPMNHGKQVSSGANRLESAEFQGEKRVRYEVRISPFPNEIRELVNKKNSTTKAQEDEAGVR